MLKEFLKNRAVLTVLSAALTVLATSVATAYPDVYRAICVGSL